MKKIMLTTAIALTALYTQAQISVAPEAGVNLANMSFDYDNTAMSFSPDMKPGLKAGAVVTFPVVKGFFVQPGLFFSMKGCKVSNVYTLLGAAVEEKNSVSLSYLEIPVNLGYEYKIGNAGSVFATAGPYLGYAFSGRAKGESIVNGVSAGKTDEKIDLGSGNTDDTKPLDFGLNFSAGYKLPLGAYVRVQYGLGLANLAIDGRGLTTKNNVLAFSVGYAIGL